MTTLLGTPVARRAVLGAAVPIGSTLVMGNTSIAAPPQQAVIDLLPKPRFRLSPYLYMQFMEPLGTTDGSVEASWNHLTRSWRADLVEATEMLAPPMLRWGGLFSAYYRWREGVGPRDRRRPMHNLMWGGIESNQIGTDEFLDFCGLVGAEPLMCVNFESEGDAQWAVNRLGERRAGSAQEAAEWVAYCNSPTHAERAANGHLHPRPVRYWQIGNETSYRSERFSKAVAIGKTIEFARAMRSVDKNLKLIAWGDSGWGPDMLAEAGELVDMLAFHHLFDPGPACRDTRFRREPGAAWASLMESVSKHDRKIEEIRAQTGKNGLALTEAHYQIGGRNRGDLNSTWAAGVAFARMQNVHQRHGDVLQVANLGDFCGTRWQTNVVMLPTPAGKAYLMPVGKVAALYRAHAGSEAISLASTPPGLDAVASRSGDRLFVHAVNTNLADGVSCRLTVGGRTPKLLRMHQLSSADPFAEIISAQDDPVTLETRVLAPAEPLRFPAASVTAVEVQL
jgi:alpha-N-arabinofuranosidase